LKYKKTLTNTEQPAIEALNNQHIKVMYNQHIKILNG